MGGKQCRLWKCSTFPLSAITLGEKSCQKRTSRVCLGHVSSHPLILSLSRPLNQILTIPSPLSHRLRHRCCQCTTNSGRTPIAWNIISSTLRCDNLRLLSNRSIVWILWRLVIVWRHFRLGSNHAPNNRVQRARPTQRAKQIRFALTHCDNIAWPHLRPWLLYIQRP